MSEPERVWINGKEFLIHDLPPDVIKGLEYPANRPATLPMSEWRTIEDNPGVDQIRRIYLDGEVRVWIQLDAIRRDGAQKRRWREWFRSAAGWVFSMTMAEFTEVEMHRISLAGWFNRAWECDSEFVRPILERHVRKLVSFHSLTVNPNVVDTAYDALYRTWMQLVRMGKLYGEEPKCF